MRIIKEGKIPKFEEFNIACSYCNTEIGYTTNDENIYVDELYNYYAAIICPLCEKHITTIDPLGNRINN